jgi:hypothetical protein
MFNIPIIFFLAFFNNIIAFFNNIIKSNIIKYFVILKYNKGYIINGITSNKIPWYIN